MKHFLAMLFATLMLLSCLPSLAEGASSEAPEPIDAGAVENGGGTYRVIVCDQDGNPVEGAVIQLCDDVTCSFQPTDADGIATFAVEEQKVYEAHVLQAPEGYAGTEDVYNTLETFSDVRIILEKADQSGQDQTDGVVEAKKSGLVFSAPESFKTLKGIVEYGDMGDDYMRGEGIVEMIASYIPMSWVEYENLWAKADEAEEAGDMEAAVGFLMQINDRNLFSVYGINGGRGIDGLIDYLLSELEPEKVRQSGITRTEEEIAALKERILSYRYIEIGTYDGFTYILQITDPEQVKGEGIIPGYEDGYFDEYVALLEDTDAIIDGIRLIGGVELTDPVALAEAGTAIRFETTDLDGNPVKSEDLFAGHAVTMINLWGTWCGPCKREIPELESMNRELAEKNCQIIGIAKDADNDEKVSLAKEILAERGVTYVNLIPFEGLSELLPQEKWPTSYFVDENGVLIGEPIAGAYLDRYREMFDQLLMEMD